MLSLAPLLIVVVAVAALAFGQKAAQGQLIKLDIHVSDQDVLTATLATLQGEDAKTEAEKVGRLLQQYRVRGLAVIGPLETFEALANGQVDELLVSGALEETGAEILDTGRETVSEEPPQVSLSDQLMTKARHTGATITFIEDARLLESVGGVGAFLRWRG